MDVEARTASGADGAARERAAQTIVAIASPPGPAERGILRLSGPGARAVALALVRGAPQLELSARGVHPARLFDGVGEQPGWVVWMPGPRSYTGEDVAELHGPGAPPLVAALLRRALELGARLAGPGEFTRRAFENGRIDLTRAEGVLELVSAANERERRAATALLSGGLERHVSTLRDLLLDLRVLCEASLDFDEADTGHVPREQLEALALAAREALADTLSFERRRVRSNVRPRAVLIGAPNAGKSTLFNALTGGRALVSPLPGATRDVLRAAARAGEFEFELVDTAGLDERLALADREHPDLQAQQLASAEAAGADLLVAVVSAVEGSASCAELLERRRAHPRTPVVLAWTQVDRPGAPPAPAAPLLAELGASAWVALCAPRAQGVSALLDACRAALEAEPPSEGAARVEVSARHLEALNASREALEEALGGLRAGAPLDLLAQTFRQALDALDAIAGRSSPEDVLERLFARFCIGK